MIFLAATLSTGLAFALAMLIHYLCDDVPGDPVPAPRPLWRELADASAFFAAALLLVLGITEGMPA